MDTQTPNASLLEEIAALERRLQDLPDQLVEERIEIRKILIRKRIQAGQTINI